MKDYYKKEKDKAELTLTLVKEAIKARAASGAIEESASTFTLYAETLGDAEDAVKRRAERYDEVVAEETKKLAAAEAPQTEE